MNKSIFRSVLSLLILLFHTVSLAGPRDDAMAEVTVYKEVTPSGVIYNYSVRNKSDVPIIGLTVGFDYYSGHSELTGADPINIGAPTNWSGRVISLEESDRYEINWEIKEPGARLEPGQTLSGFQITAAQNNPILASGHWTLNLDRAPVNISSRLRLVEGSRDTIPPNLSVQVTPNVIWPPDRRMVTVAANISVTDNQDTNPKVKLVSITCIDCSNLTDDVAEANFGTDDRSFMVRADRLGKRKDGRIYKVTYSATDVSGNTSTAVATVAVPHDQRRK